MKLNSLGRFRRRRRLKKILLALCALLVGFLIAAESRFAFMRVGDVTISPPHILPQYAVWGTITPEQERFWPSFWLAKGDYEKLIEAYYPADVTLALRGWGKFSLAVSPLIPLYKVYWGGKFWYLSGEGKLWLSSLPENKILAEHSAESLPVLAWGADRATPIDIAQADGNVFGSSLPLPLIRSWYRMAEELGWSKSVKFIQAGVKEGTPVVRVIFYTAGNENGAQLLLPNEAERWPETGLAVKKLYGGISNLPPDIFIDGTYKGKILIRNLKQDKKEAPPPAAGEVKGKTKKGRP
ncbi:MAG: hypothetical protein Q4C86_04735 [bacterium]|nr:hypothetical protein [bacterium]